MASKPKPGKRRRRRRGRSGFAYAFFTVVLIGVAVYMAVNVFFKISRIEVSGCDRYSEMQIIETAGVSVGDNLLFLPSNSVIRQLFSAYPYIERVRLERRLPSTLKIEIVQRTVAGVIESGGKHWLIDPHGFLLESVPSPEAARYTALRGVTLLVPAAGETMVVPEDQLARQTPLLLTLQALESAGIADRVTEVDVGESFAITFRYDNRLTVILGNAERLEYKMRFLAGIEESLGPDARGRLDISGEKGNFAPETAPPAEPSG